MLARAGEQQGVKDAEGMKRITAIADAEYVNALAVSKNAFMKGLITVWSAETAKGGDAKYLASAYTAMIGGTRTERDAANSVRKIYDLAAGSNPKAEKWLAHQAAAMGVTNAAVATDADVEAEVQRGGKDSEDITGARARIAGLRQQAAIEREKFDAETPKLNRGKHRRSDAALAAREDAFHHEQDQRAEELRKAEQKMRDDTQKIRDSLTSKDEIGAWRKIGLQQRVERIIVPTFGGGKTDEERNQIVAGLGGGLSREDAAFSFSEGGTQTRMNKALADAGAAKASDVDRANRAYEETSPAVNARTQGRIQIEEAGSVEPEEEYANRFGDEYTSEAKRITKRSGVLERLFPGNGTINLAVNDGFKEMVGSRRLYNEMRQVWDAMTPDEQKQHPEMRDLIWRARQDLIGGSLTRPYWAQQTTNNQFALEFGKIRQSIFAQRHKAGGPDAFKLDKIKGQANVTTDMDLRGSEFDLEGTEFDPKSEVRKRIDSQNAPAAGKSPVSMGGVALPPGARRNGIIYDPGEQPVALDNSRHETHYHITQNVASQYMNDGGDGIGFLSRIEQYFG